MKLILIFAQAITQQEQIIGFFMKQFICFFRGYYFYSSLQPV